MAQKRHITHGRDHEHEGADPTRIYWEDVGVEGGGGEAGAVDYGVLAVYRKSIPNDTFVEIGGGAGASTIENHVKGGITYSATDGLMISETGLYLVDFVVSWSSPIAEPDRPDFSGYRYSEAIIPSPPGYGWTTENFERVRGSDPVAAAVQRMNHHAYVTGLAATFPARVICTVYQTSGAARVISTNLFVTRLGPL